MAVWKNTSLLLILLLTFLLQLSKQQLLFPSFIGAYCEEDDRCTKFVPSSVCRDNHCACATEYVSHPTNTSSCLAVAKNIHDPCEERIQCTTLAENSVCGPDKKCNCIANHHFVIPSQCVQSKGLNETCIDDSDCYLERDGTNQNIVCIDKLCVCRGGHYATSDKGSCKSSGNSIVISITCLTAAWAVHVILSKLQL